MEIEYEGGIDEDIYQINIADEDYFAPVVYTYFTKIMENARLLFRENSRCLCRK
ncbi:MAG: hypothetical protein ACLUDU_07500 [Butyricimonas faecihominis]